MDLSAVQAFGFCSQLLLKVFAMSACVGAVVLRALLQTVSEANQKWERHQ